MYHDTQDAEVRAKAIAEQIVNGEYPIKTVIKNCAATFWGKPDPMAPLAKKEEYDKKIFDLTKKLAQRECISKGIPVEIFLEGAYMPQQKSTKLVYHSQFLPQLYRVYAERLGLPLQTTWEVKYKVLTGGERQEEYRQIAMYQNKLINLEELSVKAKEIYDKLMRKSEFIRIVSIPKNNVAGYREDDDEPLFVLSGCYDIIGAIGYMNFELGGKQERFYFDYNIDTDKTKLVLSTSKGNRPTSYGQYPQQITYTKWCRACVESYYRSKLVGVKLDNEDDVAREKAEEELREKAEEELREREEKLIARARANEA